ncbi:RNase H domain-containing protein [Trichonephila clavipes]|nr:RNase H domain-containing protein [Trichonephila clavipes]
MPSPVQSNCDAHDTIADGQYGAVCSMGHTQQESWSQQLDNKLHSVKPVVGAWPVMPMRRTDVKLTRLRIGHTRFTHRHLLLAKFGSRANNPKTHSLTHYSKGFDIVFCWLPSHVGIIGNEQADCAARSATTHLPVAVPLPDMKRVILHHIFQIWQESWIQQLDNKLHSVKPVIGAWPVMPMRRTDVKLTRLRIGHIRFTHRHLFLGECAPQCPSCKVSYTVRHVLIDCPVFDNYRFTFFNSSHLTLPDLVGETPRQNLFVFIRRIGFLYLI